MFVVVFINPLFDWSYCLLQTEYINWEEIFQVFKSRIWQLSRLLINFKKQIFAVSIKVSSERLAHKGVVFEKQPYLRTNQCIFVWIPIFESQLTKGLSNLQIRVCESLACPRPSFLVHQVVMMRFRVKNLLIVFVQRAECLKGWMNASESVAHVVKISG